MNGARTSSRIAGALLLTLLGGGIVSGVTEQDLLRVFEEHHIDVDREAVEARKLEGILEAVDRRARIVSTNDPAWSGRREAIEAAETWAEAIAYLDVTGLGASNGAAIVEQLRAWNDDGMAGIIFDLREAGGSNLEAVQKIAQLFMPRDTSLYAVRDGAGEVIERYRTPVNPTNGVNCPLMVLIDRNTSGASEILAAVLKGRDGVMLIGEQTGGHEGLMEIVPLDEDDFLYVATRWVLLEERAVSLDQGIVPDVEVDDRIDADAELPMPGKERVGKVLSDRARRDRTLMERVAGDAGLARATDVLLALNALGGQFEGPPASTNVSVRVEPPHLDAPADE